MFDSHIGERCPGEADCQRFQLSEEPKLDACATCELKGSKPIQIEALTSLDRQEIETHVDRVFDLASQQRAGFPLSLTELSEFDFEMLKLWHSTMAFYERQQRAEQSALLAAFMKAMCR